MFFTFSTDSHSGAVMGEGWNVRYEGCASGADAWIAAQADGFALAPGTDLGVRGAAWTAQVVRG